MTRHEYRKSLARLSWEEKIRIGFQLNEAARIMRNAPLACRRLRRKSAASRRRS